MAPKGDEENSVVKLTVPQAGQDRYIVFKDFAIGPYDQAMCSAGDVIELPSALTHMQGSKGIWHENNVEHDKIKGDIVYHPFLSDGLPCAPSSTGYPYEPYCRTVPVKDKYGNPGRLKVRNGVISDRVCAYYKLTAGTWYHTAAERNPENPDLWTIWYVHGNSGVPPRGYQYNKFEILSINKISSTYVYVTVRTTNYQYPRTWDGVSWDDEVSFETVKTAVESCEVTGVTIKEDTLRWYYANPPSNIEFSPSEVKAHIDAIAAQLMGEKDSFPLEEVHYGDLATRASKQVNANKVNMIAFLRDLKNPKSLIPKLKNLRSLEGLADNYLTVNYGILPTISDLKGIVAAFRKVAPFLDKNGFQVFTASSRDSTNIKNTQYSLEQRIKLAISTEDDGFQLLLQQLESMGTLPTLENVWDLIPYSFVLDWFVDVGGFLERVDTRLRLLRLNIRYATMSRKIRIEGMLKASPGHPYAGYVTWEHYHRWVSSQCPVPPLSLQMNNEDFNHWLESGALLVQRNK